MRPGTPARTICTRCLNRCRLFSTTSYSYEQQKRNALPPSPPRSGYARLTNRALISVTGVDSITFLQGLITQNMLVTNDQNRAVRRTGSYTAFLNSQGRVLNDAFIYPFPKSDGNNTTSDDPGWIIEVDKTEVTSLLKHLKRHKLRAKLKLRALDDGERTVWSSWNDHSEPKWAAYNLGSGSTSSFSPSASITGCIDTRAPGFGSRLITPGSEDLRAHLPDEAQIAGSEVELDTYTIRRMLHGIAEGQREIVRESALPLECNLDMMRGVDFRKGCYVGQELTIRTHHTGVVRKRILPVQLYNDAQDVAATTDMPVYNPSSSTLPVPPSGSNISRVGGRKGRSAGKFLGGIGNIGLANCRLEMMTDINLTGDGTQYNPEHEFKLSLDAVEGESAAEVKVKAILPPWLKEYILFGGVRKSASVADNREDQRIKDFLGQLEGEVAQSRNE
ncbi:ccr4 associated factor [Monascus purpureus]|nr:ccr4 associated factor [Monascus purpureus]